MVTGSVGRQLRSIALALFEERSVAGDGAVMVTTRESPTSLARELTAGPRGFDPGRLAIVDARGSDADDGDVGWYQAVGSDATPKVLDAAVGDALDWLADVDVERRHFLYDTLATDYRLPEEDEAYQRAYQVAMSVGAENGLALFTLDGEGLSGETVEKLTHLFDVHVSLREDHGDTELQWTGLLGASDGWVPKADVDFGVGGFR